MPTPGHSWHHCSGSPCASSATTSSCSRHCSTPAPENAAAKPPPTHRQWRRALCSSDPTNQEWGDAWSHHVPAGDRACGTDMAMSLAPCPAAAPVCASPLVREQLEVLQQIWSGRCNMPPALIPEATRACVLAHSFGWWVLRSGPANSMISSTVSVTTKKQCQQPCTTGCGQGTPVGNPWEHSLWLHSKHLTAPCSHRGDSPFDETVPQDTAPPRNDGKRSHQHSPHSHLPLLSPSSPCCCYCCCFGASSTEPWATGSTDSVVGTHAQP